MESIIQIAQTRIWVCPHQNNSVLGVAEGILQQVQLAFHQKASSTRRPTQVNGGFYSQFRICVYWTLTFRPKLYNLQSVPFPAQDCWTTIVE